MLGDEWMAEIDKVSNGTTTQRLKENIRTHLLGPVRPPKNVDINRFTSYQYQPPNANLTPGQASMNVMNNTVVVTQPGAGGSNLVLVTKDKLQSRDWTSGTCSCLNDCTSCVLGTLCLPILFCRLANRLNECALLPCCVVGAFVALRTKLRTMGGIKGSVCSDCVMTTCCGPCAACQMSREMDAMGL